MLCLLEDLPNHLDSVILFPQSPLSTDFKATNINREISRPSLSIFHRETEACKHIAKCDKAHIFLDQVAIDMED